MEYDDSNVERDRNRENYLKGKTQRTIYLDNANDDFLRAFAARRLAAGGSSSLTRTINFILDLYRGQNPLPTNRRKDDRS
jgi:hypothetical protein